MLSETQMKPTNKRGNKLPNPLPKKLSIELFCDGVKIGSPERTWRAKLAKI